MKKKGFGYGYGLQVLVFLMFFCYSSCTVSMINVTIPALVEKWGFDYAACVSQSTYGFLGGVVGSIIFAEIVRRKGNKFAIPISLICCGIPALFYGHSSSFTVYVILNFLVYTFAVSYGTVMTGTLTANWFPRKRGWVLGFSSAGLPAGEFAFLPFMSLLISVIGVSWGITVFGIMAIVIGIISFFWIKEYPEEMGLAPDGEDISMDEAKKLREEIASYKSEWTVSRLLKTPFVWIQGILYGILFMITIGIIGQMVTFFCEKGIDAGTAVTMVSMTALSGLVGSVFWGFLDTKFGTKKATIVYAFYYCLVLICLIFATGSYAFCWIAALMYGFANGGIGNLSPSMMVQTFGRFDVTAATRVINPITGVIRALAFVIIAGCISVFGTVGSAFYFMLACAAVAVVLAFIQPDKCVGYQPENEE